MSRGCTYREEDVPFRELCQGSVRGGGPAPGPTMLTHVTLGQDRGKAHREERL